ncbi:MAG: hypothetical protein LBE61_21255 [Burkholderiaceae bacterium]|jgi:hypothetical protein|nr:hypothetical protein [Burkholderiaceae bacterium]
MTMDGNEGKNRMSSNGMDVFLSQFRSARSSPSPENASINVQDWFFWVEQAKEADLQRALSCAMAQRLSPQIWFELALAKLPDAAWGQLVNEALPEALAALRDGASLDKALPLHETLLMQASWQQPQTLRPHVLDLVSPVLDGSLQLHWRVWQDLDEGTADAVHRLLDECFEKSHHNACMVGMAILLSLGDALSLKQASQLLARWETEDRVYKGCQLHEFEAPQPHLHSTAPLHMVFPAGYELKEDWVPRHWHPTARGVPRGPSWPVGGEGRGQCGCCGGPLCHLLSLPESLVFNSSDGLNRTVKTDEWMSKAQPAVSLSLCMSCLESGAGELHYEHDAGGGATCLHPNTGSEPEIPDYVVDGLLLPGTMRLARTAERWSAQPWEVGQYLYRVGGVPSWVQSPWYPVCRHCGDAMHFVLQLDSGLPEARRKVERLWGSGGLLYAFACTPCRRSAFLIQHT